MQRSSPLTLVRRRCRRRVVVVVVVVVDWPVQHHGRVGASVASSSRAGRQQATSPAPHDAERRRQTRVHDHQYQQRPD